MSGEALLDVDEDGPLSIDKLDNFVGEVIAAKAQMRDLQIAIVVGGGNIIRGKSMSRMGRTEADHMGMLSTIINSIALHDAFARSNVESRTMTGIEVPKVVEPFVYARAIAHLDSGKILILAGGTGNPYFTTDTAAALRAVELEADILLLAKYGTDGVYDHDPRRSADATKFPRISYAEVLERELEVLDQTAVTLCRVQRMPIFVFDMEVEGGVERALLGNRGEGTLIS